NCSSGYIHAMDAARSGDGDCKLVFCHFDFSSECGAPVAFAYSFRTLLFFWRFSRMTCSRFSLLIPAVLTTFSLGASLILAILPQLLPSLGRTRHQARQILLSYTQKSARF